MSNYEDWEKLKEELLDSFEQYGDQRELKGFIRACVAITNRMLADGNFTLEEISYYVGLSLPKIQELASVETD